MVVAINKAPAAYKALSSEKARTVLLNGCARDVEKDLVPIKDTWYTQGVSIVSDGRSNVKHKPLINILVANRRGATFMYAEDFSGVKKQGLLERKWKRYTNTSLGFHVMLNLIFKDLAKEFVWLPDTYKSGKMIVKYFLKHTQALSIFRPNSHLKLLKVAKTRFSSHYILLKRLKHCRETLTITIVLNSWRDWAKNGYENTRKIGQIVCETIRSNEFWEEVDRILARTKLIFLLIKFCDEGVRKWENCMKGW
ncbi:hypothetical protein CTI12_AA067530 [Artemisia annua]|uniref:DUF659 domain-containing protein n=1 Tax=Artemisia annua TaxID=35608 RepID=A0A2U1Q720_ARTAN|nr:hypothetical protein CTI12_AA067530 [Artemisia annua]